jgi:hypothetical protein
MSGNHFFNILHNRPVIPSSSSLAASRTRWPSSLVLDSPSSWLGRPESVTEGQFQKGLTLFQFFPNNFHIPVNCPNCICNFPSSLDVRACLVHSSSETQKRSKRRNCDSSNFCYYSFWFKIQTSLLYLCPRVVIDVILCKRIL